MDEGTPEPEWPLVGRAEELQLLDAALFGRAPRAVVLSGPPGVGKSRLLLELCRRAGDHGWTVERVTATRSTGSISFGPLAHLLPDGDLGSSGPLEVMRRIRDEVRRRGNDRPVLLAIDDAHLLDERSAATVHMLAVTNTAAVAVNLRARETVPDAINVLGKDGVQVELQSLSYRETADVLHLRLRGHVATQTAYRLWQITRGNALYLRELVRAGLAHGLLVLRGGVWSWDGEVIGGQRLSELIADHVATSDKDERRALELLAVGEPLGLEFLADVADSLPGLEQRGLISVDEDQRRVTICLAHPLYGEAIQSTLGTLRRREICRHLADVITDLGGDLLRLAVWRLEGGGTADPTTLLAAARQARRVFDHGLAERLADTAIRAGAGADAHVLLADALYWQGEHERVRDVLDNAPPSADMSAVTWRAIVTASNLFWGLSDTPTAERVLFDAEQVLGPGPEQDELVAHRAALIVFNGRPTEGAALARPILMAPTASDMTKARALAALIPALAMNGRTTEAVQAAELGVQVALQVAEHEPWARSHFLAGQATAYWLAGRFDEMRALTAATYQETLEVAAHDVRGLWALLLGQALLWSGSVRSALRQLQEAAELLDRHDVGGFRSWCLAGTAQAAALLGESALARDALAQAESGHLAVVRTHDSLVVASRAWTAVEQGERSTALRHIREAAGRARAREQYAIEAFVLHEAIRLGDRTAGDRLTQLSSTVDSVILPVFIAHAHALVTSNAAGLDDVAARFAERGAILHAAETASQAATVHRRNGHTASSMAALDRSRSWAAQCEGAMTPILRTADAPASVSQLTAREREIAELAARGHTNQQIADMLVLSRRTVGNHLSHTYTKLDVSNRADLAILLGLNTVQEGHKTLP